VCLADGLAVLDRREQSREAICQEVWFARGSEEVGIAGTRADAKVVIVLRAHSENAAARFLLSDVAPRSRVGSASEE